MPMGTSGTHAPSRGLTAPPALRSRRWNAWRSWQRSDPCRASIWGGMREVWRRIVSFGARSFRHRANRGWMGRRHRLVPLSGPVPGSWGVCLRWGSCWLPRSWDLPMSYSPIIVTLYSLKPFFFNGLKKELCSRTMLGAQDPGIQYERAEQSYAVEAQSAG